MNIIKRDLSNHFLAQATYANRHCKNWRLIKITTDAENSGNILHVVLHVASCFEPNTEGEIYIYHSNCLLVLVKTGAIFDHSGFKTKLEYLLSSYRLQIEISDLNSQRLREFKILLSSIDQEYDDYSFFHKNRQKRKENIILVADDDLFMRSLLCASLNQFGTCLEIDNGVKILENYLQYCPNVIFLDIHMPQINGIEVLNQILSYDPHAYVIMLSADSCKANVINAIKLGAKDFIAKPFTPLKLEQSLLKCTTIKHPTKFSPSQLIR